MLEQVLPKILEMERGIEAYMTGDKSMLLYNALEHPQTRSYTQAVEILDALLSEEGNKEVAGHFSYPWPEGQESLFQPET